MTISALGKVPHRKKIEFTIEMRNSCGAFIIMVRLWKVCRVKENLIKIFSRNFHNLILSMKWKVIYTFIYHFFPVHNTNNIWTWQSIFFNIFSETRDWFFVEIFQVRSCCTTTNIRLRTLAHILSIRVNHHNKEFR